MGDVDGGDDRVARARRKRPFVYVYDLPPEYNSRLLQYKITSWA